MAWYEDGAVLESIDKENFETFYEAVIGEPITLSDKLWYRISTDLEQAIEQAIEEKASIISRDIYEETYE